MRRQGSGSVINISSMFGQVASTPVPDAGYVASKAAVNGLTRELANQWGGDGVRVNAIAPGWFPTEMNDELVEDERSKRWLERQCPHGARGPGGRARRRAPVPRVGRIVVLHRPGDRGGRRVDDPMSAAHRRRAVRPRDRRRPADGLASRPAPRSDPAVRLHAHRRGSVEPDVQARRLARVGRRAPPPAAGRDPGLRPRHGARAHGAERAVGGGCPRAADAGLLRGRRRLRQRRSS